MADAEITILISAIDEMSGTMKNIESQLEKSNKNIKKQTEETTKVFDKELKEIIKLGQAASAADNIWSSYQNMQLRLENAAERVTGAQERLREAQYELNKTMESGTATSDDVAQAQQRVESASRSLTIAQNNQTRANNMVIGTYINMGIQAVSLIASAGPLGIALLALGGIMMLVSNDQQKYNEELAKYVELQNRAKQATEEASSVYDNLIKNNQFYVDAAKQVKDEQMILSAEIQKSYEREALLVKLGKAEEIEAEKKYRTELITQLKYLQENWQPEVERIRQDLFDKEMIRLGTLVKQWDILIERQNTYSMGGGYTVGGRGGTVIKSTPTMNLGNFSVSKMNDFIMRPGKEAISFSSDDTIMGFKGGGMGTTIIIEGNIYGVDADDIAEALQRQLNKKLSMGN